MTIAAIAGLFALNLLLLLAGAGVLSAARGWSSWVEFGRLAGLAYLAGAATVGVLLALELMAGVPFGLASILLTALGTLATGSVVGRALGHRLPPMRGAATAHAHGPFLVHAVGMALAAVYLEAQFRAGRLAGLFEWDAMAFWIPKAKALYYFGGLDLEFFKSLPGPSYPPLVPSFEAAAFEFMGSTDSITLHLFFWFTLAGFVATIAGVLATRVRPLLLWATLLFVVLTPVIIDHAVSALADLLLDYFIGAGTLMVVLWLRERRRWQIVLAAIMFSGAVMTKREGLLLTACVVAAALIATWSRRRCDWPPLLLVGALAAVVTIPWRVWLAANGIAGQGPQIGYFGFLHHLDRAWPSLKLTLKVLFDGDYWLVVPPLFLAAIVLAFLADSRTLPLFGVSFFVLATLGCSWMTMSFPDMPITTNASMNPIVRLSGGLVVPMAGLLPLLLERAWPTDIRGRIPAVLLRAPRHQRVGWALVAVVALAYPLTAIAGGAPRFPSTAECAQPATHDGNIQLVFATFDRGAPALALLNRVRKTGFVQAQVIGDACGRLEVAVPGYTTLAGAESAVGEARRVGLNPTLQQG
jgi:hypothetical protein